MIELRHVSFAYVKRTWREEIVTRVLDDVTLTIPAGQFVALTGPSGCGKTTLLRLVAGLLEPTAGGIVVDGALVDRPGPDRALVFQEDALLPWQTVHGNVTLALELAGVRRREARVRATRHLEAVDLGHVIDRYPRELSGGMRQRVGLARALSVAPRVLLLDEPFASLDEPQRLRLSGDLIGLWSQSGATVLLVTHSLAEAVALADRVLVIRDGGIAADVSLAVGRPRDLHDPELIDLVARLRAGIGYVDERAA